MPTECGRVRENVVQELLVPRARFLGQGVFSPYRSQYHNDKSRILPRNARILSNEIHGAENKFHRFSVFCIMINGYAFFTLCFGPWLGDAFVVAAQDGQKKSTARSGTTLSVMFLSSAVAGVTADSKVAREDEEFVFSFHSLETQERDRQRSIPLCVLGREEL